MKTVLIVEDEKMIRQGIRTMIQRSGVPVEVIMECSNGEAALEIVRQQPVDVMFTDIRMPKMDGIELVKEIQKLEGKPEIVAVSGYDDFSYAVEMLRSGVREYILKPVERQKITEILQKLQEEWELKQKKSHTDEMIGKSQIRMLLASECPGEAELALLEEQYGASFFPDGYRVCAAGAGFVIEERGQVLFLDDMQDGNLCIAAAPLIEMLQKNELWQEYAGASGVHRGLRELPEACREAIAARKRAFFSMTPFVEYGGVNSFHIPHGLQSRYAGDAAWTHRLHLIGTDRTDELEAQWRGLLLDLKRGIAGPDEFESGLSLFLKEAERVYRNMIGEEEERLIARCRRPYRFGSIEEYWDELMELVTGLHRKINDTGDENRNRLKIRQALEYVKSNYSSDLNMAVVSNYVSMNYTLFSYEFKQYTGRNFVNYLKDLRVAEAKRLLEQTDLKVIEISQQVGYENEKHFMKIFKSVCGVSPSEYRRNMSRE